VFAYVAVGALLLPTKPQRSGAKALVFESRVTVQKKHPTLFKKLIPAE